MTIHRAYGHVDRAAVRDGAPLRVVMCSEGRQKDKIDLRMSGANLARFRGNPVLGYGHSYWGRTNLPIGRVLPESIAVDGTHLVGELEFDQGDEFAREAERKMRAGYLNAVSIGFDVEQWESAEHSYWKGGVATKWELSELSVVPVLMDAAALVTAGRADLGPALLDEAMTMPDDEFVRLLARTRMLRAAMLGEPLPDDTEDVPEPDPAGINEDTARTLLGAFTIEESHA